MPFVWSEVEKMGQIYGNRNLGSKVDLTNKMWFSYPGYNEILTGKADDSRIDSTDKIPNPNKTIIEIANDDPKYKGKVAAFGSWDVFPYIIDEERSGVPVNSGFEIVKANNAKVKLNKNYGGFHPVNSEKTKNRLRTTNCIPLPQIKFFLCFHQIPIQADATI